MSILIQSRQTCAPPPIPPVFGLKFNNVKVIKKADNVEENEQNEYIWTLFKEYYDAKTNFDFNLKDIKNVFTTRKLKNIKDKNDFEVFRNFDKALSSKEWFRLIIVNEYFRVNKRISEEKYETEINKLLYELIENTNLNYENLLEELNSVFDELKNKLVQFDNDDIMMFEQLPELSDWLKENIGKKLQNILRFQKIDNDKFFTPEELLRFLQSNYKKFLFSETYKRNFFKYGIMWPDNNNRKPLTEFFENNVFSDAEEYNKKCAPLFNELHYSSIKSANTDTIARVKKVDDKVLFNTCVQSSIYLDKTIAKACQDETFKQKAPNICQMKNTTDNENKEIKLKVSTGPINTSEAEYFLLKNKVPEYNLKPFVLIPGISEEKETEVTSLVEKPKINEKYLSINESLKKFYENINAMNEITKQKNPHFIDQAYSHIKERFGENDTRFLVADDFEYTNQAKLFGLFEDLLNKGLDALKNVYADCQILAENKDVHVTNFNNLKYEFEALQAISLSSVDEYTEKIKNLREHLDDSQQDIEDFFIKSNEYELINKNLREELNKLKTRNFTLESASDIAIKLNDDALIYNQKLKKENTELKRDISNIMLEFNNQVNTLRKLLVDKENSIMSLRDEVRASNKNNEALHNAHEQIIKDMQHEKQEMLELFARAKTELGEYVNKIQDLEHAKELLHEAELVYIAEKQRVDTLLIEENERFAQKERVYTSQLVLLTKLLAQKKKFFTETENARDVLRIIEDESAEIIRETLAKWYIHKLEKKNTEKERNLQRQIWRETHHGVFQIVEMLDEFITQPLILKNGFKFSVFLKNVGKMCLAIMMMLLLFVPSIKYLSVGQSGSGIALSMPKQWSASGNAQYISASTPELLQLPRAGLAQINEQVVSQAANMFESNAHSTCIADLIMRSLDVDKISADLDKCAKKQEKFERLVEENADIIKELQRLKNADEQNNYDLEMKKSETRDLINEMSELRQEKKTLQTQLEKTTDALSLSQQNVEQMNEHANEQTVRLAEQHSQLQLAQEYAAGNQTRVLQLENEVKTLPSRIVEIIEFLDRGERIPLTYTNEEIDAAANFIQLQEKDI